MENAGSIETICQEFVQFREECIWLRDCYNTFTTLFDDEGTRNLLEKSAQIFFGDLNRILREYIYLQVCKITDPAKSLERENLTVEAMNKALKAAKLITPEIKQHAGVMMHYRDFIKEPRNRLISHLDKETIVNGAAIGEHDADEVTAFFDAMQEYCDEVGRAVGVGPLDFRSSPGKGDTIDLLRVLRNSTLE